MAISGGNGELIHPTSKYLDSFRALITDQALHGRRRVVDPDFDASDSVLIEHLRTLDQTDFWWLVNHEIVGRIRLREPASGDFYESHGDVGYDMSPRFENQGHATKMLQALLIEAKNKNRKHLLITCHFSNLASKRVMEKNGGVFRDIYADEFLRYDFELG